MKRILTITIMVLLSAFLFGQTPTNYKEGDFTGKQIKTKSIKLDNNWLIDKGSTGTISWKYNGAAVATFSATGAWSTLTVTGASTHTGAATFSSTIAGTVAFRDTCAFLTTATRRAKYVAGGLATDFYVATKRGTTGSVRPVDGDMVSVTAKADSVILERQAGTTSGAVYNIIRLK